VWYWPDGKFSYARFAQELNGGKKKVFIIEE